MRNPLNQLIQLVRKFKEKHPARVTLGVFFLMLMALFYWIWLGTVVVRDNEILVRPVGVWGDWAMHFTQTSRFAYHSLIPGDHPLLEGAPYSYPFAVNWLTAVLVRAGMEFFAAHVVISFALNLAIVAGLISLFVLVTRSTKTTILGTLIFLCNGGFGFYWLILKYFFPETVTGMNFPQLTHVQMFGIEWINVVVSMFLPQRSFALGFPIALLSLLLIINEVKKPLKDRILWRFILAGVLAGLLPLTHTHSYLALNIIYATYMIWEVFEHRDHWMKSYKKGLNMIFPWIILAVIAAAISLPTLLTQYGSTVERSIQGSFIRWYPGWFVNPDAPYKEISFIQFWLMNWGVTLPLALFGWFVSSKTIKKLTFPFGVVFVAINLFLFQPFIWDNTKMLIWASLGVSLLAGVGLATLWRNNLFMRIIAIALFVVALFSGAHDIARLVHPKIDRYGMYNNKDLQVAQTIRKITKSDETVVGTPFHNNPVINLTGRNIIMGYPGWLWTYGFEFSQQEKIVHDILKGGPRAKALIEKYNISIVAYDRYSEESFEFDREWYRANYPTVYVDDTYELFDVRTP